MNCIDCSYSLLKDGHCNCTYEEGECIKINVLEKENAGLKEKYDTCLRENTGLKIHNTYVEKKLSESKDVIKELIECLEVSEGDEIRESNFVKRAEQFLKEVK